MPWSSLTFEEVQYLLKLRQLGVPCFHFFPQYCNLSSLQKCHDGGGYQYHASKKRRDRIVQHIFDKLVHQSAPAQEE